MKTLTINRDQLQTAFHMFVVSVKEDRRRIEMDEAAGLTRAVESSDQRTAETGARRVWQMLELLDSFAQQSHGQDEEEQDSSQSFASASPFFQPTGNLKD